MANLDLGDISNDKARAAIEQRRLQGRMTVSECEEVFSHLAKFDARRDDQQIASLVKFCGGVGCFYFVFMPGLALGLIIACFVSDLSWWYALLLPIVAGVVGRGIFGASARGIKHIIKLDIKNDFRESLTPFFEQIAMRIPGESQIDVDIELREGPIDDKRIGKEFLRPQDFLDENYEEVSEESWHDPWCRIDIRMPSGYRLQIAIESTFRRRDSVWRDSASGGQTRTTSQWEKEVKLRCQLAPAQVVSPPDSSTKAGPPGIACRIDETFMIESGMAKPEESIRASKFSVACQPLFEALESIR